MWNKPCGGIREGFWRREPVTHSAPRLEGGFQYVPWSHSLHNIIKQFKLALLTQALNAVVSWWGKSHQVPPMTTPQALHPPHSLISFLSICALITGRKRRKKSVLLASACQGLPGGMGLFHSSALLSASQPHILPAAAEKQRGGRLSDIALRESGTAVKAEWIHRLRDSFHLITALLELFNTNAELLVGSGWRQSIRDKWKEMRKKYNCANQTLSAEF